MFNTIFKLSWELNKYKRQWANVVCSSGVNKYTSIYVCIYVCVSAYVKKTIFYSYICRYIFSNPRTWHIFSIWHEGCLVFFPFPLRLYNHIHILFLFLSKAIFIQFGGTFIAALFAWVCICDNKYINLVLCVVFVAVIVVFAPAATAAAVCFAG